MIIQDKAAQVNQARFAEAEARRNKWIDEQEALANFVVDGMDNHPFDASAKWGRWLETTEFERRLGKLCPNLAFRWGSNPARTDHKWLMLKTEDGWEKFATYPNPKIPERSLWRQKTEQVPDRIYGTEEQPYNPADFPQDKRRWIPIKDQSLADALNARAGTNYTLAEIQSAWEPNGKGIGQWVYDDDAQLPGMKTLVQPWGELLRGYRSILVKLVQWRVLTPHQVETEFLRDNTPEWAGKMGHQAVTRPW